MLKNIDKPMFPTKIVFVWVTVFLGIVLYAMFWFIFGTAAMTTISAFTDSFTFDSPWDETVELIINVIYWHPILAMSGWLIYGYVNSLKRDVTSWQT